MPMRIEKFLYLFIYKWAESLGDEVAEVFFSR